MTGSFSFQAGEGEGVRTEKEELKLCPSLSDLCQHFCMNKGQFQNALVCFVWLRFVNSCKSLFGHSDNVLLTSTERLREAIQINFIYMVRNHTSFLKVIKARLKARQVGWKTKWKKARKGKGVKLVIHSCDTVMGKRKYTLIQTALKI